MEQAVDRETDDKQDFPKKDSDVDRKMVLSWLKGDIQLARRWARQDYTIKNPMRIHCLRTSIYGCSIYLQGLKDEELEIRVKALEEKLKDGVLIHGNK